MTIPTVTHESAILKIYHRKLPIIKSKKSTTSPKKILSVKLPKAPAIIKEIENLNIKTSFLIVYK